MSFCGAAFLRLLGPVEVFAASQGPVRVPMHRQLSTQEVLWDLGLILPQKAANLRRDG